LRTRTGRQLRPANQSLKIGASWLWASWQFRVIDDPSIDTTSRTGKLVMGILALIAEFENDIRREHQLDGIAKAKQRGVRFGVEPKLTEAVRAKIRKLRSDGMTVPAIMKRTELSNASVYRALSG
jgi:DNA invertase Pin-like site-specific DNA recombinase